MNYEVLDKQSTLDIALQALGSAEAVVELAEANDISITDDLEAGQQLAIPTVSDYTRKKIIDYYNVNKLKPATALDKITALLDGIDYMIIEIDFIIR